MKRMKQSVLSSIKSVNYLLNVMVRVEAAAKGWDETILLNDAGFIAEGGGSNVSLLKGKSWSLRLRIAASSRA